jgi:hypothetical protein
MISIAEVLWRIGPSPAVPRLAAPEYIPPERDWVGVGLAVEDMARDVTSEGWDLFLGLQNAGYQLFGHRIGKDETNVREIIRVSNPTTVVVQDEREWDTKVAKHRDKNYAFTNIQLLQGRSDIFKLTIIKDAHQRPKYHSESASRMGCHAWITNYNPRIICHLAPYIRPQHLIRTYHTVNPEWVPPYVASSRLGCFLSGAKGSAYPLRTRLFKDIGRLQHTMSYAHPGYGNKGCQTPHYLRQLSRFKVSICTSSLYNYALRKIIESTACGCRVITDLSPEDPLPWIDDNLIRIHPGMPTAKIADVIREAVANYQPEKQEHFRQLALDHYNNDTVCYQLAQDIEVMRASYNEIPSCTA